jgi:hypothetical protein
MSRKRHTHSPLLDLLRYDPKDRKNLDHDLHDDVVMVTVGQTSVNSLKTLKKVLNVAKEVYKGT